MPTPAQLPTIGRIVHYTLPDGRHAGEVRAAMVTNVFPGAADGACNGTVFLDEANDEGSKRFFSSAKYDDPAVMPERVSAGGGAPGYQAGTWHWPPRA